MPQAISENIYTHNEIYPLYKKKKWNQNMGLIKKKIKKKVFEGVANANTFLFYLNFYKSIGLIKTWINSL